jgi:uncharacterized membrane protein YkoI
MERTTRTIIATTVAATALALGIAGAVAATTGDDAEPPITGVALERASEAALAHTGGGRVTETELGDEDSYYEVEVTLDDGRQIDVQLDRDFAVVASSADVEDDR